MSRGTTQPVTGTPRTGLTAVSYTHLDVYKRQGEGNGKDYEILGDLPQQNIDTGLGVERLAMLLQGVENFYETDQVRPVLDAADKLSGLSLIHS